MSLISKRGNVKQLINEKGNYDNVKDFSQFLKINLKSGEKEEILLNKFNVFLEEIRKKSNKDDFTNIFKYHLNFFESTDTVLKNKDLIQISSKGEKTINWISDSYANAYAYTYLRYLYIFNELNIYNQLCEDVKEFIDTQDNKQINNIFSIIKDKYKKFTESTKDYKVIYIGNTFRIAINTILAYETKYNLQITKTGNYKKIKVDTNNESIFKYVSYNKNNSKTKDKIDEKMVEYYSIDKGITREQIADSIKNYFSNLADLEELKYFSNIFFDIKNENSLEKKPQDFNAIKREIDEYRANFLERTINARNLGSFAKNAKLIYNKICNICGIEEQSLLDSAHILELNDERFKNTKIVSNPENAIILCKNCHTLLDKNLIKILAENKIIKIKVFTNDPMLKCLDNKVITLTENQKELFKIRYHS